MPTMNEPTRPGCRQPELSAGGFALVTSAPRSLPADFTSGEGER